jgi:hypothetical protein
MTGVQCTALYTVPDNCNSDKMVSTFYDQAMSAQESKKFIALWERNYGMTNVI